MSGTCGNKDGKGPAEVRGNDLKINLVVLAYFVSGVAYLCSLL